MFILALSIKIEIVDYSQAIISTDAIVYGTVYPEN